MKAIAATIQTVTDNTSFSSESWNARKCTIRFSVPFMMMIKCYIPVFLIYSCLTAEIRADEVTKPTSALPHVDIDPNSADIQSSTTYDLGDRTVVIQEVTEATLPMQFPIFQRPQTEESPTTATNGLLASRKAQLALRRYLSFGGTVYKLPDGRIRSLMTYRPNDGPTPITFWSTIDWNLLRGTSYNSGNDILISPMIMISTVDVARISAAWSARGKHYNAPTIPYLIGSSANYQVVSGELTQTVIGDLNAVHAFYDREYAALFDNNAQREDARRQAATIAAPPLQSDPIIIQGRPMTPEELALPEDSANLPKP